MAKLYFSGLNGIRTIAASVVVSVHIDQYLHLFGLPNIGYSASGTAPFAVTLFFALSGFLITSLLLEEKKEFRKIDFPKFYLRRILRIWPVYYAVIITSLILVMCNFNIGTSDIKSTYFYYTFLLSNLGFVLNYKLIPITPLWSVGVEEQFYSFWPLIISKSKNTLLSLSLFIFLYIVLKFLLRFYENGFFYSLVSLTQFDSMAIGGIAAYLAFDKSKILKMLFSPIVQITSWVFLCTSLFWAPVHISSLIDPEIHSFFYSIVILNLSTNDNSLVSLENKFFNYMGKISYGFYMYHMTIIFLLSHFYVKYNIFAFLSVPNQIVLLHLLIILLTIGVSQLSYNFYESYFLRIKTRYSKI